MLFEVGSGAAYCRNRPFAIGDLKTAVVDVSAIFVDSRAPPRMLGV